LDCIQWQKLFFVLGLSVIRLVVLAGCAPFGAAQVYPEVAPQFTMFRAGGTRISTPMGASMGPMSKHSFARGRPGRRELISTPMAGLMGGYRRVL